MNGTAVVLRILTLAAKLKDAPEYERYADGTTHPLAECRYALMQAQSALEARDNTTAAAQWMNAETFWKRWHCHKYDLVIETEP